MTRDPLARVRQGDTIMPDKSMRRLEGLLRPFFDKYDDDSNQQLDIQEFWAVFHDLQEHVSSAVSSCHSAREKATRRVP